MEIELPDGTILDAPDDADPSVVAKAYLKNQRHATLLASNPGEYDPQSPEFKAKYGPTAGSTGFQNFAAGAGKAVVDTGRGIKQLALDAADLVRSPQVQDLVAGTPAEQYRKHIDTVNQQDAPLLKTGAGLAGNVSGYVATAALPGGILGAAGKATKIPALINAGRSLIAPATLKGAAAIGAAQGFVQPVGTDQSRIVNTAAGGLLGAGSQAVGKIIGRIAEPVKNALTKTGKEAVETLRKAGVSLDAAQASGSERLRQVKRFLTDNPLTGPGQVKQAEKTASTFNAAALKTIGEDADVASEEVLNNGLTRIQKDLDRLASGNPIKLDNGLLDDLVTVSQQADSVLESQQAAVIKKQIDEIITKGADDGNLISGPAYQNIKTTLDLISNGNMPGRQLAGELRDSLFAALERSASKEDAAAVKAARSNYRKFLAIEKSVGPDGNISPAKLYNAQNTKAFGGKRALSTGRNQNDLMELAKAGKQIIPERLPNSGTAPRGLLQLALPGAIGAGYGYAKEGDFGGALAYGAGGIAAPYALQKLINNPSAARYLTEGLGGTVGRGLLAAPNSRAGILAKQLPTAGLLALQGRQ